LKKTSRTTHELKLIKQASQAPGMWRRTSDVSSMGEINKQLISNLRFPWSVVLVLNERQNCTHNALWSESGARFLYICEDIAFYLLFQKYEKKFFVRTRSNSQSDFLFILLCGGS
jgi:hypothetical protein